MIQSCLKEHGLSLENNIWYFLRHMNDQNKNPTLTACSKFFTKELGSNDKLEGIRGNHASITLFGYFSSET